MPNLLVGQTDTTPDGYNAAGYAFVSKHTAVLTDLATSIKLRVAPSVSGDILVGIYDDDGIAGFAGTLLGLSALTAVSSGASREIEVMLLSGVSIVSGSVYWLAGNANAALIGRKSGIGVQLQYKLVAGLPSPAGTGWTNLGVAANIMSAWGADVKSDLFTTFF